MTDDDDDDACAADPFLLLPQQIANGPSSHPLKIGKTTCAPSYTFQHRHVHRQITDDDGVDEDACVPHPFLQQQEIACEPPSHPLKIGKSGHPVLSELCYRQHVRHQRTGVCGDCYPFLQQQQQ
jgi:hypothetical protein